MQTQTKYSSKFYPGNVVNARKEGNYFYFYTEDTILELSVKTDKIIRFRYAADGFFQKDFSYAVSKYSFDRMVSLEFYESADYYEIQTMYLNCRIWKENVKVTLYNKEYDLILEEEAGFHWQHYLQKGGKINYCSKKIQPGESFFGLGDKPTELNLKGKFLENFGTDTYGFQKDGDPLYKNIPFYMGLHGDGKHAYGIFFDNTFRTIFDFGSGNPDVLSFWARGGEMNYYFIYGPELMSVVEQYSMLTGTPEMPPMWALGYQQCRWSYYPENRVKEIAAEFRKRKIPCDAIYLDIDYMDGFRCFTWNHSYFPDPKGMISDLAKDGFKTVVIIDPGIKVDKDYWVWQQGIQNDYFCRRADGTLMEGDVWPGKCHFPDFTRPEVREWWKGLFQGLIEAGVRGVWNDMNEPAVFEIGTFPEDVRHGFDGNPCSHRKAHNVYGMQMARATHHGVKKFLMPNRPFVITRSAYSGVQRYSSVWTGDNIATWEHLWIANVQCQRLAVSGISFAGSDVGGFIGEPDGELYTRWIQLAAFHPFFRTHSAGNDTNTNQEPWTYGTKYESIVRRYINLRYQLLPYLYTAFWQNVKFGTPILRPIAFLDQHDPNTHHRMDEFGYGDHILVCPILESGQLERSVYLPRGTWYHNDDERLYLGGQEIIVDSALDQFPIFVKAGAVIPFYPKMQYVGEQKIKELTLHVYYDKDNEVVSTLYEDAGDNYGYINGQFNLHKFETLGKKLDFSITHHQESNGFDTDYNEYKIVFHGIPFEAKEYILDGKTHKLSKRNFGSDLTWVKVYKNFRRIILR